MKSYDLKTDPNIATTSELDLQQFKQHFLETFAVRLENILKAYPTGNVGIFYYDDSNRKEIKVPRGLEDNDPHFYYWGVVPKVSHMDRLEYASVKVDAVPLDAFRTAFPEMGKYDELPQEWGLTYAEQIQLLEACYEWQGKEFSTLQNTAKRILNFDDEELVLDMGNFTTGENGCGTTYCLAGWLAFQDNYPEEFRGSTHNAAGQLITSLGEMFIGSAFTFNHVAYSNSLIEGWVAFDGGGLPLMGVM